MNVLEAFFSTILTPYFIQYTATRKLSNFFIENRSRITVKRSNRQIFVNYNSLIVYTSAVNS